MCIRDSIDEAQIGKPGPLVERVAEVARADGSGLVVLCGKIESELAGLSETEAREFCRELGIEHSGLDDLAVASYDLLGLMTFLTAGEKEVRAWTIERGTRCLLYTSSSSRRRPAASRRATDGAAAAESP